MVLSILLAAAVIGYTVYILLTRLRDLRRGKCSGCAGCPCAGSCDRTQTPSAAKEVK